MSGKEGSVLISYKIYHLSHFWLCLLSTCMTVNFLDKRDLNKENKYWRKLWGTHSLNSSSYMMWNLRYWLGSGKKMFWYLISGSKEMLKEHICDQLMVTSAKSFLLMFQSLQRVL